MPYEDGLPFSGVTPTSRHCSYLAAKAATATRFDKTARYLGYLKMHDGKSDWEAATYFDLPLSSICSIRNNLVKRNLVYPSGIGTSPYGRRVSLWSAR